jgi:hypothetical protein
MPCDYEIDTDLRLVRTRGWGVLTCADLTANRLQMSQDPAFRSDFSQLADLREVTVIDLSAGDIRELASDSPFVPEARRALVVATDVAFGLARMYGTYRETISSEDQIRIFRNIRDAEQWLGLPAPNAHAAKT